MKKQILLIILMVLLPMVASAYDVEIKGLYYNLDTKSKTATVTYKSYNKKNFNHNEDWNITTADIPTSVEYNGDTYSVTSIGSDAFQGCSSLTSVKIPNSVTRINSDAFQDCSSLTSVDIPNSVTSIGDWAFYNCGSLTSVHISDLEAWCRISFFEGYSNPLYYAHRLYMNGNEITNLVIPESVTSIGDYAFEGCSGLTSITIGNSETRIGNYAFEGCSGLNTVKVLVSDYASFCNNKTVMRVSSYFKKPVYLIDIDGAEIKEYVIPESVTSIGRFAFNNCSGLTSVTIPNSVTSIDQSAFEGCSGLTSVTIESNSLVSAPRTSSTLFRDIFGEQVTTYIIGDNVTSIGDGAFQGCSNLTAISIPNSVTSIGSSAFMDCSSLTSVNVPNNIISIEGDAFPSYCKLYVEKGSKTLLNFWKSKKENESFFYTPYEKGTDKEILPPLFNIAPTTQTTGGVKIDNWCEGYIYTYNGKETTEKEFNYTKLKPGFTQDLILVVSKDDVQYSVNGSFTTKSLSPRIEKWTTTASSISVNGAYTKGDAKVVGHSIQVAENEAINGDEGFASGLIPGRSYVVKYTIVVDYGGEENATYTDTKSIYTDYLKFSIAQPKVVSEGNVIVSATANLDDDETNVGFEWRCVDWTNEFPSNTGTAYYFDGIIEGYIKNMNTEKLWKFRPYYLSGTGTYHYGDWMGLDPTNTSYFEPTVRTYAKISVEGNTALVKGYVLGGTDYVAVKGFKYWKTNTGTKLSTRSVSLPSNAITVEATGQQAMSANLTGLEYNSTYHYVAFATTTSGETYYGEEQMFTTPLAAAQYATFYDSQSAYTLPSGLTASVVTGVNNGKLTYKVIADGSKNNKVVPKGVAVMLTSSKGQPSSYKMTPTTSDATYTGMNLLKGSDVATTTTADATSWYYKLSYGASGSAQSNVFGWFWGANNGGAFQIEGHKAWLAVPKSSGSSTRAISIEGDNWGMSDETTDIEGIDICQEEDEAYYDLNGRRIEKPTSKGIYIYKGKKYIIR